MGELFSAIIGLAIAIFAMYGAFNIWEFLFGEDNKENNKGNKKIDNENKSNAIKKISMLCSGLLLIFGVYSCFSSGTHPIIDRIVNDELSRFSHTPYYICFKKDVKFHIEKDLKLTQREIDALNFRGRGNTELMAIKLNIMTRVNNILADRAANSPCIPNWE